MWNPTIEIPRDAEISETAVPFFVRTFSRNGAISER